MYSQLNLFSQEIHEYFFLIRPDPKTEREVRLYKHMVGGSIPLSLENRWSAPHLSLFKWTTGAGMEEEIIRKTGKALQHREGFTVQLDGLDVYTHGNIKKTLVLKVKDPGPIVSVNQSLVSAFRFRPGGIRPHITIVQSIPVNQFHKISCSLSQFDYRGEFSCNKITILKKVIGEDPKYRLFHEARLN
jgi:2'-5' RNA ligase